MRRTLDRWIYPGSAALVGFLWLGALLAHPSARAFLLDRAVTTTWLPFLAFPMLSVLLALPFRFLFKSMSFLRCVLATMVLAELASLFLPILYYVLLELGAGRTYNLASGDLYMILGLTAGAALHAAFEFWVVTVPAAIASAILLRWASRVSLIEDRGEPLGAH